MADANTADGGDVSESAVQGQLDWEEVANRYEQQRVVAEFVNQPSTEKERPHSRQGAGAAEQEAGRTKRWQRSDSGMRCSIFGEQRAAQWQGAAVNDTCWT